uniref:DUF1899 domain-containing protein n=1 Tax=Macrostomum lignano TaxID=282301 RepID=A0A1I8F1S7_9PLAT
QSNPDPIIEPWPHLLIDFASQKFKHVFGKPAKRDMCYDNIRITKSSWDSTFCAMPPGGGALSLYCRLAILDIQWCPHDDDCIASASEDCTAKVWRIGAESFSSGFLTDPYRDLVGHNRRVGADNKVLIWNVEGAVILCDIDFPDVVHSCSFNWTGSLFVCSCKDKMGRVINARTEKLWLSRKLHEGAKPQQVVFLRDGRVFSTRFLANERTAMEAFGKGDSAIRYFEVTEDAPYFHFSKHVPKLRSAARHGLDAETRLGRVHTARLPDCISCTREACAKPISFTVPRKSELF